MSINTEELMKNMLGAVPTAPIQQNMVAPEMVIPTMVAPAAIDPTSASLAPVAPIGAPIPNLETPAAPTTPAASVNVAPAAPIVPAAQPEFSMPEINPVVQTTVAPAVNTTNTVVPTQVAVENSTAMAAVNAVEASPTVGSQLNLQNGLDLDNIMTQEEEVKLAQQEKIIEPITIGGLESIGTCKTSTWSALITILEFIAKGLSNNDVIEIDKGLIDTHRNGNFIHCDMRQILGNISLNLTAPETSVKLLKLIKGGELIQIFKENATQKYVYCNIQDGEIKTRVKTSFSAESGAEFSKAPILAKAAFKKEIPPQEKEILKTIISGRSASGSEEAFRFGFSKADNTLVSVGVGKDFTHFFKDSKIETDEYRCYNPFPVPNMDSCIIEFYKEEDGSNWIRTISNINVSSIVCTEKVELIDSSIEDFSFN